MSEWKETEIGLIPKAWEFKKIGNCPIHIGDGNYSSKYPKASEFIGKGIPFISSTDLDGLRIKEESLRYISSELHKRLRKGHIQENDVLIVVRGNGVGDVALVDRNYHDANINAQLAFLRCKEIDPQFLYYLLSSQTYKKYIDYFSSGSAQPQLTIRQLNEIKLVIPPRHDQKNISSLLYSLDRKISNLRQQNETLEKIAQTLFKHWFVDFEFPNEDGKPYRSSGGEMVRSELGEIPAGWYVKKMGDVIDVRDGTHESPKQTKEGFHLITSKHLKKGGIDFDSAYLISESDYIEANKRSKVDTLDILVSMIGTVGLLYFVMEQDIRFAIKNMGLFKSSKNLNYAEFVFLFLTSVYGKSYLRTRMGGTTQSFISLSSLREMDLLIPDELTLLKFRAIAKIIFTKSYANSNQVQTLTKTRDRLLPKLMSGQLRIPQL